MKEISICGGHVALIDDMDFDKMSKHKWHRNIDGYAVRTVRTLDGKKQVRMHREILGLTQRDKILVDHIDGNRLNNTRANLRRCNSIQNNANTRPKCACTSGYKGVYKHQSGRWIARIRDNGKKVTIGMFDREIDAALAYNAKARELHGDFAYINIIEEA